MKKRIFIALLGLIVLIGILAGIKILQIRAMMAAGAKYVPPPETVTTAEVKHESWESLLTAVGSLDAVQGVVVSAELAGKVVDISFKAGQRVRRGEVLLRQDISTEEAQLPGAKATLELARRNRQRMQELLDQKMVSQSEFDSADATARQAQAAVDDILAAIAKKVVRAPFEGRLGIRQVNLGQNLSESQAIVSLQTLDPIFVNFQLPQQQLEKLQIGLAVRMTTDTLPGREFTGSITAVNPEVDPATRNIQVQATLANPQETLRPGMFVNVAIELPQKLDVLVAPATSVLYAPYGDSVFVVEEKTDEKTGKSALTLRQQFVHQGARRGDFVALTSGVKEGETLVTTGVFKLRNGQAVVVDNKLSPEFEMAPKPENN